MNFNALVRQSHRWISLAFTLGVIANIVAIATQKMQGQPPMWVGLTALIPLVLLLASGLYLFVVPYAATWRARRREAG